MTHPRTGPAIAGALECLEARPIVPGQWLVRLAVPGVVAGIRAGQVLHLGPVGIPGAVLRRAYPVAGVEPVAGIVTLYVDAEERFEPDGEAGPAGWPAALRVGDRVWAAGPFGRPIEVDPRSRHLLLVAVDRLSGALRLLVDEALRDGRNVTLLFGAPEARAVFPSALLPDPVEYVVATADGSLGRSGPVEALLPEYEAWADQAVAAGPIEALARIVAVAAGRRERLGVARLGRKRQGGKVPLQGSPAARRRAFLQVVLPLGPVCALGVCLGCVREGTAGPVRVCRDGPVVAAEEVRWPEAVA
jgi:dihydroorotate dehydrogenase electron transfer subunit